MTFWDNKQILLTRYAGLLGTHIAEQVAERGVRKDHLDIPRNGDLDRRIWENYVKAVKGKEIVIHLAYRLMRGCSGP